MADKLEKSVGCETCSSLDLIGCRLVSHEECGKDLDDAINKLNYIEFRNRFQDNYPRLYKVARFFGF